MAYRVTTPITKYGRYYAAGDVIDEPTSVEQSLARIHKWETVSDPAPSISGLRKPQLVQLAEQGGLDVEGLTKSEIVDLLEG